MTYTISQIIGVFGLICSVISFQKKDRKGIIRFQVIASCLFALQLFMVGGLTGAYLDCISFVRTMVFAKRGKRFSHNIWLYLFLFLMLGVGIYTYQDFYSIFAIAGAMLSTLALWMKDGKRIRMISLFVGPCWIIYNISCMAYTGALNEVIAMISIIIGILRHDLNNNKCSNTMKER